MSEVIRHGGPTALDVLLDKGTRPPRGEGWLKETSTTDKANIRWLQSALNKILGLKLAVDGDAGPQTRSAIRSFQERARLKVDGIANLATMSAIRAALSEVGGTSPPKPPTPKPRPGPRQPVAPVAPQAGPPSDELVGFIFGDHRVRDAHRPQIAKIAGRIAASQSASKPIQEVRLVGHTDPVGSDLDNFKLGLRRAEAVREALKAELDRLSPGLASKVTITVNSRGETEHLIGPAERNRRVQVFVESEPVGPESSIPEVWGTYPLTRAQAQKILGDSRVSRGLGRHRLIVADNRWEKNSVVGAPDVHYVEAGVYDYDRNLLVGAAFDPPSDSVRQVQDRKGIQPPLTAAETSDALEVALANPSLARLRSGKSLTIATYPARASFAQGTPWIGRRIFTVTFWNGSDRLGIATVDLSSRQLLPPQASDEAFERGISVPISSKSLRRI